MAMYTYRCRSCDHELTEIRKIADREAPTECPKCGGVANKIIDAPSIGYTYGEQSTAKLPGWFKQRAQEMSAGFKGSRMNEFT